MVEKPGTQERESRVTKMVYMKTILNASFVNRQNPSVSIR